MKQVLIFSGTTEGRRLAEVLSGSGIPCTVCVATEYGEQVMDPLPGVTIRTGRMLPEEMAELLENGGFSAVVDATHPFATVVSENIIKSMEGWCIPYLRLQRENGKIPKEGTAGQRIAWFETNEACAGALEKVEGNILLTTGSKDLKTYCADEAVRSRLYVRVLPAEESLSICKEQGLAGKQILALQGPFSEELNAAILKQYRIRCMVTKESGKNGGFEEKAAAAEKTGALFYVIGSPKQENGITFLEVCEKLETLTGKQIAGKSFVEKEITKKEIAENKVTGNKVIRKTEMQISLIGIGMGNPETLTVKAKQLIDSADYLLGASRLLEGFWENKNRFPFYQASDILPFLEKLQAEETGICPLQIAVLFSGDSGFYSGCGNLYQALLRWKDSSVTIRIYPGISSVSCLSALTGISWQDAKILSVHGRGTVLNWGTSVREAVRYYQKTFLLLSGAPDVRSLGALLQSSGLAHCRVLTGYQLSYPEQEVRELSPKDCVTVEKEGLYLCLILNDAAQERPLTHGKKDELFCRGRVPMTKEEIREISICKLRLHKNAVVYDIGSGTGSIAVEVAACASDVAVYAVEKKEEAQALILENCKKFRTDNVTLVAGEAPEILYSLPAPTHAFIGGSGGNLKEILSVLYEKNPVMRIVINAVTLETLSEINVVLAEFPVQNGEIVQVQVSRANKAGRYHLMQAENPVYICSFDFGGGVSV